MPDYNSWPNDLVASLAVVHNYTQLLRENEGWGSYITTVRYCISLEKLYAIFVGTYSDLIARGFVY